MKAIDVIENLCKTQDQPFTITYQRVEQKYKCHMDIGTLGIYDSDFLLNKNIALEQCCIRAIKLFVNSAKLRPHLCDFYNNPFQGLKKMETIYDPNFYPRAFDVNPFPADFGQDLFKMLTYKQQKILLSLKRLTTNSTIKFMKSVFLCKHVY